MSSSEPSLNAAVITMPSDSKVWPASYSVLAGGPFTDMPVRTFFVTVTVCSTVFVIPPSV